MKSTAIILSSVLLFILYRNFWTSRKYCLQWWKCRLNQLTSVNKYNLFIHRFTRLPSQMNKGVSTQRLVFRRSHFSRKVICSVQWHCKCHINTEGRLFLRNKNTFHAIAGDALWQKQLLMIYRRFIENKRRKTGNYETSLI